MLNLRARLDESSDVFSYFVAQGLVDKAQVRRLYESRPSKGKRIVRAELSHEKQYAMNLLNLIHDGRRATDVDLAPEWSLLLDDLTSSAFVNWLESATGLGLRDLVTDIGMFTHEDGDFISIHKDKPTKALTAILYLNEHWPQDAGGHYEVRRSADPAEPPACTIPPRAGQFLAFPPTDRSWHAVAPVRSGGELVRLTVQMEFWLEENR